jgi:hypothetical protein
MSIGRTDRAVLLVSFRELSPQNSSPTTFSPLIFSPSNIISLCALYRPMLRGNFEKLFGKIVTLGSTFVD